MRRGLLIILQGGAVTSLDWWNTLKVDGCSLVLANVSASDDPELALVIAKLESEAEAQAMFSAVMKCMRFGVRRFDPLDGGLDTPSADKTERPLP